MSEELHGANGGAGAPGSRLAHSLAGDGTLPGWFLHAGQALLLFYACTRLYTDKPADIAAQVLALMSAIALLFFRHPLRRSVVTGLFLLVVATQLATWGLGHWLSPEIAERSPKVERLAAWFFLIPVALFVAAPHGQQQQRVLQLWLLAAVALALAPWLSGGGWAEIARGIVGERVGFGLLNQQHTGMLFGVALIGLCVFAPRARRASRAGGRPWLVLPYGMLLLVALAAVLLSQTRAIWLALLVTSLAPVCAALWRSAARRGAEPGRLARRWRPALGLAGVAVLVPLLFGAVVMERYAAEQSPAASTGEMGSALLTSENIRVRLNTWTEALRWIAARPLFGWGGHGRKAVVQASAGLTEKEKVKYRHLHNSYLDTLVGFGIAGLAVLAALLWWLGRRVLALHRQGALAADFLWFWIAFVLYWLVANLFESWMYYTTGLYAFALVCGAYLALVIAGSGEPQQRTPHR